MPMMMVMTAVPLPLSGPGPGLGPAPSRPVLRLRSLLLLPTSRAPLRARPSTPSPECP